MLQTLYDLGMIYLKIIIGMISLCEDVLTYKTGHCLR